ncbi:MAG: DUF721 domain-containing protein [Waddliaceae bacterium]
MKKFLRQTPKGYDGTKVTTHQFRDLLTNVLADMDRALCDRPRLIIDSWPGIIGPTIAPLTKAASFRDGVLVVRVKNSTVYSLLSQNEKPHLLKALRKKFPNVAFRRLVFRLG